MVQLILPRRELVPLRCRAPPRPLCPLYGAGSTYPAGSSASR